MMKRNKKGFVEELGISILFLYFVGLIVLMFYGLIYATTEGTETITIEDKWVKQNGNYGKYLISSKDGQVFEITDSIWHMRFDSSNLYSELKDNQTCDIHFQGS